MWNKSLLVGKCLQIKKTILDILSATWSVVILTCRHGKEINIMCNAVGCESVQVSTQLLFLIVWKSTNRNITVMVFSRQQSHAKHARYFSATINSWPSGVRLQHSQQTMTVCLLSIYITLCDENVFIMLMFIHLSVPSVHLLLDLHPQSLFSRAAAARHLAARYPPLWSVSVLKCVYQSIRTLFNVILISTVSCFIVFPTAFPDPNI